MKQIISKTCNLTTYQYQYETIITVDSNFNQIKVAIYGNEIIILLYTENIQVGACDWNYRYHFVWLK